MLRRLDAALTVLVLIMAVAVGWNLVRLNGTIAGRSRAANVQVVGKQIAGLKASPANFKKTLVLYVNPGCHFCEESMDFYKRLIASTQGRKDLQVVVATPLAEEIGQAYARKSGLAVERVVAIAPGTVGLQGTPTLLLLNEASVVVKTWVGKLRPPQEGEVEQALLRT